MIAIGDIISLISVCIMCLFNIITISRLAKHDVSSDSEKITRISIQVDMLTKDFQELKKSIEDIRTDTKNDHDDIIELKTILKGGNSDEKIN